MQSFAAVRVARDLEPQAMRLVDDGLHLLEGQRRAVDERRIRFEDAVLGTDEVLRRVDLDPVHTAKLRLADGRACEPGGIQVLVLDQAFAAGRVYRRGALVERRSGDLQPGTRDDTLV